MDTLFILLPLFCLMFFSLLRRSPITEKLAVSTVLVLGLLQLLAVLFYNQSLMLDNLSRVLLLSISIVLMVTAVAAEQLIDEGERKLNFASILLLMLSGMNGIALARDIFTLYVFIEITSVASFIIIALKKERDGLEGAMKYIIFSTVATVLLLASIALTLLTCGSTSFQAIKEALLLQGQSPIIMLTLSLYLIALFIKSGLMPFHGWLPDAYSASTSSVSILLAGIVTKAVGVYPLIRIIYSVFGPIYPAYNVILFFGALSIVGGALAAIGQSDFKRLLAYSSISQVGYIVIGLGTGSALGMAGAIFHLFNHSIFKSLLFLNAAAVKKETGLRDINEMGGLAANMPVTGATSVLAALSISGIPPLAGFWSKLLIVIALWQSHHYLYAVIAVLASLLTLGYMLNLQRKAFFGKANPRFSSVRESGIGLSAAAIILAAILIGAGLFFPYLINSFLVPVGAIL